MKDSDLIAPAKDIREFFGADPCKHTRTVPEQHTGGFSPNEHGESHVMGRIDGERCLSCGLWQMTKRVG